MSRNALLFLSLTLTDFPNAQEYGGVVMTGASSSSSSACPSRQAAKPASSRPTAPAQSQPVTSTEDDAEFRVLDEASGKTIFQDSAGRVFFSGRHSALGKGHSQIL